MMMTIAYKYHLDSLITKKKNKSTNEHKGQKLYVRFEDIPVIDPHERRSRTLLEGMTL